MRDPRGWLLTAFVVLLRGINVGGNKIIPMAELRAMLAELGYEGARTLLQSGNAVLRAAPRTKAARLEAELAACTRERFGHEVEYFARTADEWDALLAGNPFEAEARTDPARLAVLPLAGAPSAGAVEALQAAIAGRERVRSGERALYAYYPDGMGNSKLTLGVIERKLGTRATARNWNTALKLAALARELTAHRSSAPA